MAIHVVYRKTLETDTEVEYRYGDSEKNLDTRLVIDKANPKAPPRVGPFDPIAQKVIARLIRQHAEIDQWPNGGAIQS